MIQRGKNDYRAHSTLICNFFFLAMKRNTKEMIFILSFRKNYTFSPPAGHYDNLP